MKKLQLNKRKNLLLIFSILIAVTGLLLIVNLKVQAGTIQGSNHDLTATWGTEDHAGSRYNDYQSACVYCHVPHNSNEKGGPLWNRPLPSATAYTTYDSGSLDSSTGSISVQSLLCLSCHDGTIAVDSVLNKPSSYVQSSQHRRMSKSTDTDSCGYCHSGTPKVNKSFLSQDLSDDHPVSFTYDSSLVSSDGELESPSASSGLGGTINETMLTNGKVECTSCHNVHDPQYGKFLIKPNDDSQLCNTCHVK